MNKFFIIWKQSVQSIRLKSIALYFAFRDPRTPWYARFFSTLVLAYAFSPIDLIPDFIPILGYLDDLILIPLGIYLAVKMIPVDVMDEASKKSEITSIKEIPDFKLMGLVVILIWIILIGLVVRWGYVLIQQGRLN